MAKEFKISPGVLTKLRDRHHVSREEVIEAFLNRTGPSFADPRQDHQTDPPTMWFVALTDRNRVLKVVYIEYGEFFAIKTAFTPTDGSDGLYARLCAKQGRP